MLETCARAVEGRGPSRIQFSHFDPVIRRGPHERGHFLAGERQRGRPERRLGDETGRIYRFDWPRSRNEIASLTISPQYRTFFQSNRSDYAQFRMQITFGTKIERRSSAANVESERLIPKLLIARLRFIAPYLIAIAAPYQRHEIFISLIYDKKRRTFEIILAEREKRPTITTAALMCAFSRRN